MSWKRCPTGKLIRAWYRDNGVRVVTVKEWGCKYRPDLHWDRSEFVARRYHVGHHNGRSAQLPRLEAKIASGISPTQAGIEQMRYVENVHTSPPRNWRMFAYTGAWLPWENEDGQLVWYEGRSSWLTHGAHHNDPLKADWPVYYMLGARDTEATEIQQLSWRLDQLMLRELFGWTPTATNQKLHREVQGWDTTQCCDPVLGNFIRDYRHGLWIPPGGNVSRIAGANRYATAAAVSQHAYPAGSDVVYVASGEDFPDAVAAASSVGPVLLTERDRLPSETADEILRLAPSEAFVVGGAKAVSSAVEAQIARLVG